MTEPQKLPWKRLSLEAVAMVRSILLAFAFDAWWKERLDRSVGVDYEQRIAVNFAAYAQLENIFERNVLRSMELGEIASALFDVCGESISHDRLSVSLC